MLLVFPDGRFVPGWTRYVAAAFGLGVLSRRCWPTRRTPSATGRSAAVPSVLLAFLAVAAYAQVHRYRHVSGPAERQQTKWVVSGLVGRGGGFLAVVLVAEVLTSSPTAGTPGELVAMTLVTAAMLLIPLSIGIAVLRHRLFDIDLIINRALVYGVLTAGVVGLYVLVVGSLGACLRQRAQPARLAGRRRAWWPCSSRRCASACSAASTA